MNSVVLMGRLTRDPELRYTQSTNTAQCSFTIAVDRRFKAQDGSTKADFINCVAWRQTAEFISKYFAKGSRILVLGSIQVRDYENNEGKKVYVTEVIVEQAEFCESKGGNGGNGSNGYQPSFSGPVDSAPKGEASGSSNDSGYFPLDTNDFVPF